LLLMALQVGNVIQGAKSFVYGPGNSAKGHVPGVQVTSSFVFRMQCAVSTFRS